MIKTFFTVSIILLLSLSPAFAQNQLDSRPLDPERDPDIDLFMNSWQNSRPFNTHGHLTERFIFVPHDGDPLNPPAKGAVFGYFNRFSRALLDSHARTSPTTLEGEQEVLYFLTGNGTITGGGETHDVHYGVFVLVPEGLEFVIENEGAEPITLLLINEPVPEGFRPNEKLLVKDETEMPYRSEGYFRRGFHWNHNGKGIFTTADGLAELEAVTLHTYNAMTFGQPHSHEPGVEEVFCVVEGRNLAFLGKEIRWQLPGTAYMIPPTGYTPHCNINTTNEPVKALYFARYGDHDVRP